MPCYFADKMVNVFTRMGFHVTLFGVAVMVYGELGASITACLNSIR